ncbi:MAG: peptide-methionine (R)-S-oxide reductase [Flavobacteriales bacterium]|nr:peptide-methionine (R)-S-oxide reductase [Flavobacteriales bacterium]|tara:strand:+ start:16000 stop:16437 length:438 start_codon:yes stop_codon:yes gene_type:complete
MIKIFFLLFIFQSSFSQDLQSKDYFKNLTSKERKIIVDKGTERPYTGKYNNHYKKGTYVCKACSNPLFKSNTKFDSKCGWPSFDKEIEGSVIKIPDYSLGMKRTEIVCSKCKGHLGHIFYGEKFTKENTRHCVNSISLNFIEDSD